MTKRIYHIANPHGVPGVEFKDVNGQWHFKALGDLSEPERAAALADATDPTGKLN